MGAWMRVTDHRQIQEENVVQTKSKKEEEKAAHDSDDMVMRMMRMMRMTMVMNINRNTRNTYFSLAGAVLREVTEVECDWAWRSAWCAPLAPVDLSVGSDSRDRWAALAGETPWPPWPMDSEGR